MHYLSYREEEFEEDYEEEGVDESDASTFQEPLAPEQEQQPPELEPLASEQEQQPLESEPLPSEQEQQPPGSEPLPSEQEQQPPESEDKPTQPDKILRSVMTQIGEIEKLSKPSVPKHMPEYGPHQKFIRRMKNTSTRKKLVLSRGPKLSVHWTS